VVVLIVVALLLQGCASPRQMLLAGVADALAAQSQADEDDLHLARDAAPFYLKLSESLLQQTPGHFALAESVAGGFTQYAYAFVAFEADRIEGSDSRAAQRMRERAARLYERAHRHAMLALEQAQPGFRAALAKEPGSLRITAAQAGLAYWAAASWAAAISLSKDRPDTVADLPQAVALAQAAYAADAAHGQGALASLLGTLEASRPGGSRAQALAYFDTALASAGRTRTAVYVAMAEALALPSGDRAAFERWLQLALQSAQPAAAGRLDLGTRVMTERAQWLLASIDDLF
jgi:predicted anti-sigma-YlaC factor YlaD